MRFFFCLKSLFGDASQSLDSADPPGSLQSFHAHHGLNVDDAVFRDSGLLFKDVVIFHSTNNKYQYWKLLKSTNGTQLTLQHLLLL